MGTLGKQSKRSATVSVGFSASLKVLIDKMLACNVRGCGRLCVELTRSQAHFVRCIKPNHLKKAGVFDDELVRHQVC